MRVFDPNEIKNVGLISHTGAGKTSIAEAFLFNAGVTSRLCKVDDENSNFDFEPEEQKRRSTTKTAVGCLEWNKYKINIIDTPGDHNFIADTREAFMAMDSALIVVSAADGVEVGTERVWSLVQETETPCAFFINKLDRDRASFHEALTDIKEHLCKTVVPLQLPIGAESGFRGVVDLVHMKAYVDKGDESGTYTAEDIPADMADAVSSAREALVEGVAETRDDLMEKYFEEGDLSDDEVTAGLSEAMRAGTIVPVLCGAATQNVALQPLMNLITESFPGPVDRQNRKALKPGTDEAVDPHIGPNAPFSGYIFKTIVDPYAGQLSLVRIFSGSMGSDGTLHNASTGESERYSALFTLTGKKQDVINGAKAGDIIALAKLKAAKTGQTFSDGGKLVYESLPTPHASISFAIHPKSQSDEAKLSTALKRIMDEDIAIALRRDEQTKQFLVSGMGQVHVETMVAKLERKFGVGVELREPKVPYRETIRKKATSIRGRHKKQTGGAGQFGECIVDMSPNERDAGFEFVDNIVGGSIPRNFIPAVEKGFVEAMARGFLAGYPVVDIKVRVFDGSYHAVDSSEIAFKTAAHIAFRAGMDVGHPCIIEPIMDLELIVPDECMGDVMGDMNSRRGRVMGMDARGRNQIIRAQAPLAEVLRYAVDLRSMTSGRGEFTMTLAKYEVLPDHLAEKVIAESKSDG